VNEKPIFKQLNFKLSEKQLEDLEKLSKAMGNVSKSNLIRIAITEYIMKYKNLIKIVLKIFLFEI
jgi:metal-responsive CopG/Arc/MetJ family transcriptional regulator